MQIHGRDYPQPPCSFSVAIKNMPNASQLSVKCVMRWVDRRINAKLVGGSNVRHHSGGSGCLFFLGIFSAFSISSTAKTVEEGNENSMRSYLREEIK
jgi:hypothetical protein